MLYRKRRGEREKGIENIVYVMYAILMSVLCQVQERKIYKNCQLWPEETRRKTEKEKKLQSNARDRMRERLRKKGERRKIRNEKEKKHNRLEM